MKPTRFDLRLNLVFFLIAAMGAVLMGSLWYMQIVRGEEYQRLATTNRIRLIRLSAPRGIIYDRHGEILADNRPGFDVVVNLPEVEDRRRLVEKLGEILDLPAARIESRLDTFRERPFEPVTVASDIGILKATILEEMNPELGGVQVVVNPVRNYPAGSGLAHLLGYVGQISPRELERLVEDGYRAQDDIGKIGVEAVYDRELRGTAGGEQVQVTARGFRDRLLSRRPARAGNNLHLTIDLRAQTILEELMDGYTGSAVAVDPVRGDIMAMVSNPSFDPNLMVRPVDDRYVSELFASPGSPMLNRALAGEYPPGSIFKPVVALAALEFSGITPSRTYDCGGIFSLGSVSFRCWREGGHGRIDLSEALKRSCNVYFYRLGLETGVDGIEAASRRLGLGQRIGIELGGERPGLVPGREWKRSAIGEGWYPGDTVNLSIGQGFITVTPIQAAWLAAVIAREGTPARFRLVSAVSSPEGKRLEEFDPVPATAAGFSRPAWAELRKSLLRAVAEPGGTAHGISDPAISIAGKTGTAQVAGPPGKGTHSWFVGMAPADDPEVVVAVILEHAGRGSEHAAPLAGRFLAGYLVP